ncbi:MAG: hypothetical protein ACYS29_17270 [Planctomycetota bacterium]|jgi:hypothetical protein
MRRPIKKGWGGSTAPSTVEGAPGLLEDGQWEIHEAHYAPSISASVGNQYKTFPELEAAVTNALIAGYAVDVFVEENATIPAAAGSVAFSGVTFRMPSPLVTLTIEEGVTFTGAQPPEFVGGIVDWTGSSSPITAAGFTIFKTNGTQLVNSGSGPFVTFPDGATLVWINTGGLTDLDPSGYEVFEGTGTSSLLVLEWASIGIPTDSLRGVATTSVQLQLYGSPEDISNTQTNLPGGMTITLKSAAVRLGFDGAPSGMTAALDVQAAIDRTASVRYTSVTSSPYSVLVTDRNLMVTGFGAAAVTLNLPSSAAVAPEGGAIWGFWMQDQDGTATGTYPMTPTPTGGDTIVGAVTAITGAYGAIYVYTYGSGVWFAR